MMNRLDKSVERIEENKWQKENSREIVENNRKMKIQDWRKEKKS
mgnify:CR=1 FL=1